MTDPSTGLDDTGGGLDDTGGGLDDGVHPEPYPGRLTPGRRAEVADRALQDPEVR